jgi:hypothetical protein
MITTTVTTRSLETLKHAMSVSPLRSESAERLAKHEQAHFEEARRLGYDSVYVFTHERVSEACTDHVYKCKVMTPIDTKKEDVVRICLAPDNPSKHDYELARQNGWTGEELRE